MFGSDPNKQPGFGLGNTATGTQSGFSFTSPTGTTGTAFGTPATQAQPAAFSFSSATSPFAASSTSLFGSSTGAAGGATTTVAAPFGSGAPSIFGQSAPSSTGFGFGSTTAQTTMGFPAFGGTAAATPAASPAQSLGFGSPAFSTPAATTNTGGFGSAFGQAAVTTSAPFGFGASSSAFGSTVTAPQTTATGLTFGNTGSALGLGGGSIATAAPSTGGTSTTTPFMGFGQSLMGTPQSTTLQAGSLLSQALNTPATTIAFPTPLTSSTPAPTLSLPAFGAAPAATTAGGITFGTPATTTKPIGFGTTTAALTTSLPFGSSLTTSTTAPAPTTLGATGLTTGFAFGQTAAKTTASGFSLMTATTTNIVAPAPLNLTATTAGQSLLSSTNPGTLTTQSVLPAVAVANPSVPPAPSNTPAPTPGATINFRKLEEDINKWTTELEEQERIFLTQATQVNAWDRVLIANGEKITQLNDALERVKLDQEHLDTEVDFIEAQQRELEELLLPLEKSVESLPNLSIHQHADLEREQTFQMAENIDAQLRQMSKDLKEIIEHINTTAGTQDTSDPIYQISKILNAHMDSLQWIDQSATQLQKKVEEVGQLYEMRRQDHQRGAQLPF